MTDHIDLDEMDVEDDEEPDANRGDWFWRGEGDPEDEPDEGWLDAAVDSSDGDADDDPLPGVPRQDDDSPVGIPVEGGGAGGGPAGTAGTGTTTEDESGDAVWSEPAEPEPGGPEPSEDTAPREEPTGEADGQTETGGSDTAATGPHGGGADDMTMALTYEAVNRLDDPRFAIIDAKRWSDWVGIVGDVSAYVIKEFQRDHEIDIDFFSGAAQEPAERLADVDEHSMFYADRMVLVGTEGERAIAERAGWEFVPLEDAAEKADWDLDGE